MIFEDIDSYFNSGLEETGTVTTASGSSSLTGIFFDKEDQETFMEMEIETDDPIFYCKKSSMPGDVVKGSSLLLTGRNGGSAYKVKKLQDDKLSTDFITAIYLSKD